MESSNEPIGNLTANIILFELDLNKVYAARQEIILKINAGTHTQEDLRVYIILSKRIVSTTERKVQTLEKICEYYKDNEPENIKGKQWSHSLEISLLELEAQQSALADYPNAHTEKTKELFRRYFIAKKRADDFDANINSPQDHSKEQDHLPGLAKAFFEAPGPTYETLVLGKLVKTDGTQLNLPNCGINSFASFQRYGEEFESFYKNIIQVTERQTASTRGKIALTLQSGNKAIEEAWKKVEKLIVAQTKQAQELLALYHDIQKRIPLPVTIDSNLEKALLRLDALQHQLEQSMTATLEAQKAFHALIKP